MSAAEMEAGAPTDAGAEAPGAAGIRATYRLQLHRDFTLAHARTIVPYLSRLGISDLYLSPVLRSRPGSTHGYDVVDPTRLDPELGSDDDWDALQRTLREHGMGLVLDIVPNHMGVGADNPFWDDLFANGPASRYARWFDIDWDAPQRALRDRVLIPILGDPLGDVIARGEITLAFEQGRVRARYFENSFPLDPATLPRILALAIDALRATGAPPDALTELEAQDAAFAALPPRQSSRASAVERRQRDAPELLRRLESLAERSAPVRDALERATRDFAAGEEGRARLRALLDAQVYALEHWRRAGHDINYRRFFDINELVALRMEDPTVFGATHRRIIQWVKDGELQGLRVDHVDGLLDPRDYLDRLTEVAGRALRDAGRGTGDAIRFPVFVEKILSPGEPLRRDWPVQGTTGYEFLNDLEAIFIAPEGKARIDEGYRALLGIRRHPIGFAEVARFSKLLILRTSLGADVRRLARLLQPIAARDPRTLELTHAQLVEAIVQLIAALPVYRTYITAREMIVDDEDRRVLAVAFERARTAGGTPPAAFDLLEDVLLLRPPGPLDERLSRARTRFVQRLQQTSGPATAKGIEDTALYRWTPLLSLNEVGSAPDRPLDDAVERLHEANSRRRAEWPASMLCTSTHDTKRSGDVRSRLDVLSEIPELWLERISAWRRAHRALRTRERARLFPDAQTEYVLYQTLVGVWPMPAENSEPAAAAAAPLDALRERVKEYVRKASREAKAHTSWTDPDERFERAVDRFIDALFARREFLEELDRFVARIARAGARNALARALVHCTAPGTPDVYQGDELWSFALVDPDNRRPVDFPARERALAELERSAAHDDGYRRALADHVDDGRLKLHVMRAALRARCAHPALFARGSYEPLRAIGARARHAVAFARRFAGDVAITVVPRLTLELEHDDASTAPHSRAASTTAAPLAPRAWSDTTLPLPPDLADTSWRCAISGHVLRAEPRLDAPALPLALILPTIPVALLVRES